MTKVCQVDQNKWRLDLKCVASWSWGELAVWQVDQKLLFQACNSPFTLCSF